MKWLRWLVSAALTIGLLATPTSAQFIRVPDHLSHPTDCPGSFGCSAARDKVTCFEQDADILYICDGPAATWIASAGGGAPTNAQYLMLMVDAGLSQERTVGLNVGDGLIGTDGGADGAFTIDFKEENIFRVCKTVGNQSCEYATIGAALVDADTAAAAASPVQVLIGPGTYVEELCIGGTGCVGGAAGKGFVELKGAGREATIITAGDLVDEGTFRLLGEGTTAIRDMTVISTSVAPAIQVGWSNTNTATVLIDNVHAVCLSQIGGVEAVATGCIEYENDDADFDLGWMEVRDTWIEFNGHGITIRDGGFIFLNNLRLQLTRGTSDPESVMAGIWVSPSSGTGGTSVLIGQDINIEMRRADVASPNIINMVGIRIGQFTTSGNHPIESIFQNLTIDMQDLDADDNSGTVSGIFWDDPDTTSTLDCYDCDMFVDRPSNTGDTDGIKTVGAGTIRMYSGKIRADNSDTTANDLDLNAATTVTIDATDYVTATGTAPSGPTRREPWNFDGTVTFATGPVFDVTHPTYGAVGDGTTDDATAIQAAIDAAETAVGGITVFPGGTYAVTSTIIWKAGVVLRGLQGKVGNEQFWPTILWDGAAGGTVIQHETIGGSVFQHGIEHLAIVGPSAGDKPATLIHFTDRVDHGIFFDEVALSNSTGPAVTFDEAALNFHATRFRADNIEGWVFELTANADAIGNFSLDKFTVDNGSLGGKGLIHVDGSTASNGVTNYISISNGLIEVNSNPVGTEDAAIYLEVNTSISDVVQYYVSLDSVKMTTTAAVTPYALVKSSPASDQILVTGIRTRITGSNPLPLITGTTTAGPEGGKVHPFFVFAPFVNGVPGGENQRVTITGALRLNAADGVPQMIIESTGNAVLELKGDSDDTDEDDKPLISLYQDGGSLGLDIGLEGTTGFTFSGSIADAPFLEAQNSTPLQFATGGAARVTILSTGEVGIGDTTPATALEVTGDLTMSGTGLVDGKDIAAQGAFKNEANTFGSSGSQTFNDPVVLNDPLNPLEGASSNVARWIFKQVDFTDMVAVSVEDTFTLWTLPANTMIHDVVGTVVTAWAAPALSDANCSVGTAAGGVDDLALDDDFFATGTRYELHDATTDGGKGALLFEPTDDVFAPHMFIAGGVVEIQCTLVGDDHFDATAGQARVYALVSQPLANTTVEAN